MLSAGVVVAARQIPRLWTHASSYWDVKPHGVPWSEAAWEGWVRALPAACVGGAALDVAAWIAVLLSKSAASKAALAAASAVWLLAMVIAGAIILFNRPRWLVPPHLRRQPGLISRHRGRVE